MPLSPACLLLPCSHSAGYSSWTSTAKMNADYGDQRPAPSTISFTSMSEALPKHPSEAISMPASSKYVRPADATGDDAKISNNRHDSEADHHMQEEPPSIPGSPTYFDHVARFGDVEDNSQTTSTATGSLYRVRSFDSTAATIGSPHPNLNSLDSSFVGAPPVSQQLLLVMRHSERRDDVDPGWTATAGRPWDPPLTDNGHAMALETGRRILSEGYCITRLVVSPFLRCVQTAAEVAKALGVLGQDGSSGVSSKLKISIDHGLCEMLNPRAIQNHPGKFNKDPATAMWTLPLPELEALLPPGTVDKSAMPTLSQFPSFPESDEGAHSRYLRTFDAVADNYPEDNILCISHGEGVMVSVARLVPVTVYSVNYCSYTCAQRPIFSYTTHGDRTTLRGGDWELVTESGVSGISWLT